MKYRIGLIGAPGAGKTRLASAIKRAMPEENFLVVDNYVEKICKKLDMAKGVDASYLPNMHIVSTREQEVRKASLESRNFIVCGTIFESLCYSGFHAEVIANSPGDQDTKSSLLAREVNSAQLFAYMALDTMMYLTHLFYLPITDPEIIVAVSKHNDPSSPPGEEEVLDKTIQDALQRFGNPATVLKEKHSENLNRVLETLRSEQNGPDAAEADVAGE